MPVYYVVILFCGENPQRHSGMPHRKAVVRQRCKPLHHNATAIFLSNIIVHNILSVQITYDTDCLKTTFPRNSFIIHSSLLTGSRLCTAVNSRWATTFPVTKTEMETCTVDSTTGPDRFHRWLSFYLPGPEGQASC